MLNKLNKLSTTSWILIALAIFWLTQKCLYHYGFSYLFLDQIYYDHTAYRIASHLPWFDIHKPWGFLGYLFSTGNHFVPYMIPVSWLYKLWPTPVWLFLIQTICNVLIMYPILKIADSYFGKKGQLIITAAVFLYLPFRFVNLVDFKGDVLIAVIMSWVAYLCLNSKYKLAAALSVLFLLTKESGFIPMFSLGAYLILIPKKWKLGSVVCLVSMLAAFLMMETFLPAFVAQEYQFLDYYSHLGTSFSQKIISVFLRPDIVFKTLFQGGKIAYFLLLLWPLGFLPCFSSITFLSLGTFAQNLLSDYSPTIDMQNQYTTPLVPILLMGSIIGLNSIITSKRLNPVKTLKWIKGSIIFFIVINLLYITIFEVRHLIAPCLPETYAKHQALKLIPPKASVSASWFVQNHLAYREKLFAFPVINQAEWVFVEKTDAFWPIYGDHTAYLKKAWQKSKGKVLFHLIMGEKSYMPTDRVKYYEALNTLNQNPQYDLVNEGPGHYLFKRI